MLTRYNIQEKFLSLVDYAKEKKIIDINKQDW